MLVFCRTKHGANRLAEQLAREGIPTAAIHGDKSPPQRAKALAGFNGGALQALVATDIAARGLDIKAPPQVVNYDLPQVPENYVHRAGCAGESGRAVSLVSGEDRGLLRDIERRIGRKIEQQIVPGFEPGAGYDGAETPPPQPRRQQNPPRRAEHPRRGPRPPEHRRPQARAGQRRDPRREQRQPGAVSPSEQAQEIVRQEQLEYHRQQQAAERRAEGEPSREQNKEKDPALFGLVGRK